LVLVITSGNKLYNNGKNVVRNLLLNHFFVFGKLVNQSPPNLYLPLLYSLFATPSFSAIDIIVDASVLLNNGLSCVTFIKSNGNLFFV